MAIQALKDQFINLLEKEHPIAVDGVFIYSSGYRSLVLEEVPDDQVILSASYSDTNSYASIKIRKQDLNSLTLSDCGMKWSLETLDEDGNDVEQEIYFYEISAISTIAA
jgi:hypothetical protein